MKNWIITLPFLCATGVAMAQGAAAQGGADQPAAVAAQTEPAAPDAAEAPVKAKAPAKARSSGRAAKRSAKRLPTGDVRHCLDLKTRAEIIRCSETRPKK
jgi:hypothetical protein